MVRVSTYVIWTMPRHLRVGVIRPGVEQPVLGELGSVRSPRHKEPGGQSRALLLLGRTGQHHRRGIERGRGTRSTAAPLMATDTTRRPLLAKGGRGLERSAPTAH
jgi:hypothetical protein